MLSAEVLTALGVLLGTVGGGVKWAVNRYDKAIAEMKVDIENLQKRERVLFRRIGDLEHAMLKADLDLPKSEGWPI